MYRSMEMEKWSTVFVILYNVHVTLVIDKLAVNNFTIQLPLKEPSNLESQKLHC